MPVESSNNTGVRAPALAALARCVAAGPTLAARIDGRADNFNVLRLAAALAVLFGHSFVLAVGHQDFASVDPVSRVLMQVTGFGDLSYGVYLYAFPVQQELIAVLPDLRDGWTIALPAAVVTLVLAALSWFAVERPALAAKGTLAGLRQGIASDSARTRTVSAPRRSTGRAAMAQTCGRQFH